MLHIRGGDQIRIHTLFAIAHGSKTTCAIGKLERAVWISLGLEERYEIIQVADPVLALAREHDEMGGKVVRGMLVQGNGGSSRWEVHFKGRGIGGGTGRHGRRR